MPLSQNSFNDQMIKQPYLHFFHTASKSAKQNDITVAVNNPPSLPHNSSPVALVAYPNPMVLFLPLLTLRTYGSVMHPKINPLKAFHWELRELMLSIFPVCSVSSLHGANTGTSAWYMPLSRHSLSPTQASNTGTELWAVSDWHSSGYFKYLNIFFSLSD